MKLFSNTIRQIPVEETYCLRQTILRPGRSLSSCCFPNDRQPEVAHFAAYRDQCQLGILSVYPVPLDTEHRAWQLRAMATQPWVRRQGYGRALLDAAEDYIKSKHGRLIWCNARVNAVGFYQKAGFAVSGEKFLLPRVGEHYLMMKDL